jgi:type IV pilus assembly protein PilP
MTLFGSCPDMMRGYAAAGTMAAVRAEVQALSAKKARPRPRSGRGTDEPSGHKSTHDEPEIKEGISLPSVRFKSSTGENRTGAAATMAPPGLESSGAAAPGQNPGGAAVPAAPAGLQVTANYSYDPSGRRDPFKPHGIEVLADHGNLDLPPLQRIGLTELNLIAIVWGGFGYSAMVQTPDGKGYTVRQGTKIGPNQGVVSAITEGAVVVQERFTDVYGNKQVREYVKRLHTKEGSE